jgi:N-acyl amino acid synthase of PEP-CTERM/exosortase system
MFVWSAKRACGVLANKAFNDTYEIIHADTPDLQRASFQLRHQIFCVERGFPMNAEEGLERDDDDDRSLHFLIRFKPHDKFVGTGRIILPETRGQRAALPLLEKLAPEKALMHGLTAKSTHVCEISRLGFLKAYCRRMKPNKDIKLSWAARLLLPKLADIGKLGLYRGIFFAAQQANIDECVFCTDEFLVRRFSQIGFEKYAVLEKNLDVFGPVTAIKFSINEMLDHAYTTAPENWAITTNNGAFGEITPLPVQDLPKTLDGVQPVISGTMNNTPVKHAMAGSGAFVSV